MDDLPFEAGQLAEAKSFCPGFRGAWFRCKIKEITERKGILNHLSEYYDFSGDKKLTWTKLYQFPPYTKGKKRSRELILRPKYPRIVNENQIPHASEVSETIVIACDSWKVGDLVDWMNTGCFWSGRITHLFDNQEAQIELTPRPHGEGSSYKVHFKDIRPSLDWSLEHGWILPTPEDGTDPPRTRLIKPINQALGRVIRVKDTDNASQETEDVPTSTGLLSRSSFSSPRTSNSAGSSEVKSKQTKKQKDDAEKSGSDRNKKRSREDADSEQRTPDQTVEAVEDELNCRTYAVNGGSVVKSKRAHTLEATIMDLEDCLNKVKWVKKLLHYGFHPPQNHWKFMEPRDVSDHREINSRKRGKNIQSLKNP